MLQRIVSCCVTLVWATSTLACSDDGSSTGGGSNNGGGDTGGASDPGNNSASGAGDGIGEVALYVAAGSGVAGLEPGANIENTVDGWTVKYDKLIVTVGYVGFGEYNHNGIQPKLTDRGYIVDLRQAATPQLLAVDSVAPGNYEDLSFAVLEASDVSELLEPATDADYELMVKGGYSIYMEGTLSNPGGQSCNPEDPKDCTLAPMLSFKWRIASNTRFSGCRGFTVERDQTTNVTLTIPGDHWFRSNFRPGSLLPRRAQWMADADLDHNGETTLEELKMIKASQLFTPELDYDLAGSPIPIDTAHDFLDAQVRTLGLNPATGCRNNAYGKCGWSANTKDYQCAPNGVVSLEDPEGISPIACGIGLVEGAKCDEETGPVKYVGCCTPEGTLYYCDEGSMSIVKLECGV